MLLKNVPRFLNVETFSEALVRQHGQKKCQKKRKKKYVDPACLGRHFIFGDRVDEKKNPHARITFEKFW